MQKREMPASSRRRFTRRQIMRNRIIFALICVAIIVLVASFIARLVGGKNNDSSVQNDGEALSGELSSPTPDATATPKPYPVDMTDWRMILVNGSNPVPDGYTVETQLADSYTGKELQKEAAEQYAAMKEAAQAEGIQLILCSAYRSVDYQTGLFENEKAGWLAQGYSEEEAYNKAATVVAIPGYSEHNTGLAADIVTPEYQDLSEGFEDTPAFEWLSQHAGEYGFILRYPEGLQDVTGIIYEPWHYRYVGVENAKYIQESGLCLEQFVELMAE